MKRVFFSYASDDKSLANQSFLRVLAVLILTIFASDSVLAQNTGLEPYKESEKWGFKNKRGEVVIPAIYDLVYPFGYSGLLKVQKYTKWGVIDETGKEKIPFKYDDITISRYGLVGLKKDKQWGICDSSGKEIIPLTYDEIEFNWSNNSVILVKKAGKWGVIDRTGKEIANYIYDDVKSLPNGLFGIKKDNQWGFIDNYGKEITSFKYDAVDYYSSIDIIIAKKAIKWGFIDQSGNEISPFEYDYIGGFPGSLARAQKDKKWGFIDQTGKAITTFEYDEAKDFYKGVAQIKKGDKYGFIDMAGKEITPIEYDYIGDFSEDLARVQKDKKWSYIDLTGKLISLFKYDDIKDFSKGVAQIKKGDKYGLLDRSGNEIVPVIYSEEGISFEGYIKARKDDTWHYFDKTGTQVKTSEYADMKPYREGLSAVYKDGKWGYIDEKGKKIINPIFFAASSFNNGVAIVSKSVTKISLSAILEGLNAFATNMNNQMTLNNAAFKSSYDRLLAEQSVQREFQGDLERMNQGINTAVYLGAINKQGKEVIPLKYLSVILFKDNLYFVSNLEKGMLNNGLKYGIYDIDKEKEIVPAKYTSLDVVSLYNKNLIVVDMHRLKIAMVNYTEPNKGIVDYSGKEVIPAQHDILDLNMFAPYERILIGKILKREFKSIFSPDNYTVKSVAYGVVDYTGKTIIPLAECAGIDLDDSKHIVVTATDGTKKFYNLNGDEVKL